LQKRSTPSSELQKWRSEVTFQTLNKALCTAPILAYPPPRERFVVDKEVSNVGIEGVFSQVQDG
jgi:hypothetical protein